MSFEIKNCRFGRGLFATRNIKNGELILTFTGSLISQEEVDKKVDEEEANPLQIEDEFYIDLEEPGILVNHSCNPNVGIQNDTKLVAIRDIKAGEEIMYDYSTTVDGGWTMPCKCGEKNCRKKVKDFLMLPKKIQKQYLEQKIVQKYIQKNISKPSR